MKMDFKRGKGVAAQARLIILSVYAFFCREKETLEEQGANRPLNVLKKTCEATGVSETTIRRVRKEAEAGDVKSPRTSPPNKGPYKPLDSFQTSALRRMVHNMYLQVRKCS